MDFGYFRTEMIPFNEEKNVNAAASAFIINKYFSSAPVCSKDVILMHMYLKVTLTGIHGAYIQVSA